MAFAPSVGAGLGIERHLLGSNLEAESAQHLVEHVIVCVADPAVPDLKRRVAVPEGVAGAREREGIPASYGLYGFVWGSHLYYAAVVRAQEITVPERDAALEPQRGLAPVVEPHPQAAALPLFE